MDKLVCILLNPKKNRYQIDWKFEDKIHKVQVIFDVLKWEVLLQFNQNMCKHKGSLIIVCVNHNNSLITSKINHTQFKSRVQCTQRLLVFNVRGLQIYTSLKYCDCF